MEEPPRIVLALEAPEVAEEVLHFLDRGGRARVVGTAQDPTQLAEAVRQLEPDAVVATPSLAPEPGVLKGRTLLAVDTRETVAGLRRSLEAGARGFFLWPDERLRLAEAAGRMDAAAGTAVDRPARVIAVCGARGGAGTTFVATHLAGAFARRGHGCLLLDAGRCGGDVRSALGIGSEDEVRTLGALLPVLEELEARHLADVAWSHPEGFQALLPPENEAEAIEPRHLGSIVRARGPEVDVVVVHVPRGAASMERAAHAVADRSLVVLTLDVLGLYGARALLARLEDGPEPTVGLVVNRAARGEIVPADVRRAFDRPPIAVIPSHRGVPAAQDRGRLLPRRHRVARSIDRLAGRLLTEADG